MASTYGRDGLLKHDTKEALRTRIASGQKVEWLFDFFDGGYNTVRANRYPEAVRAVRTKLSPGLLSKVDWNSLRPVTDAELRSYESMFYLASPAKRPAKLIATIAGIAVVGAGTYWLASKKVGA